MQIDPSYGPACDTPSSCFWENPNSRRILGPILCYCLFPALINSLHKTRIQRLNLESVCIELIFVFLFSPSISQYLSSGFYMGEIAHFLIAQLATNCHRPDSNHQSSHGILDLPIKTKAEHFLRVLFSFFFPPPHRPLPS